MTEQPRVNPQQRIGDAERDRAVELLQQHHAEGRLDMEEFEQRMQQAISARYQSDLDPLFADLPTNPHTALAATGATSVPVAAHTDGGTEVEQEHQGPRWYGIVSALSWPATLIFLFATDWHLWWLIFIPIFLIPALGSALRGTSIGEERQRMRLERRRRRDERWGSHDELDR